MFARSLADRLPSLLFLGAIITSLPVLWFFAFPILNGGEAEPHRTHGLMLYAHVIGGLTVIAAGAGALYIGWTKKAFKRHRWFGYTYLAFGSVMAVTALALSVAAPHEPRSLYAATGTLAVVWLAVAGMALRAAVNRRILVHRDWMIRSYVLTWTFVGCRVATNVNMFPELGAEAVTAAIWLNWIVPFVICEMALQWRSGARSQNEPA